MQTTMMKQSEELKTLALKNQELQHRIQVLDMQISHQKEQMQRLQEAFDMQKLTIQNTIEGLGRIRHPTFMVEYHIFKRYGLFSKRLQCLNFVISLLRKPGKLYTYINIE